MIWKAHWNILKLEMTTTSFDAMYMLRVGKGPLVTLNINGQAYRTYMYTKYSPLLTLTAVIVVCVTLRQTLFSICCTFYNSPLSTMLMNNQKTTKK